MENLNNDVEEKLLEIMDWKSMKMFRLPSSWICT